MTDASLDDFFAKKDKSKKKSKSKLTPAELLEKQQEDAKPKKEKKKKDREKSQTSTGTSEGAKVNIKDDDEWIDFEEESEKDYTGLRIQNLQISKEEEDEAGDSDEDGEGEEGDQRERQGGMSGPWAVSQQGAQPSGQGPALGTGEHEPAPQPAKPKEEQPPPAAKTTGKYVPPGMRGSLGSGGSSVGSHNPIKKKKEAPNIKSEVDFPTLGGKSEQTQEGSPEANYEHPGSKRGIQVSLENKFSALQD